VFDDSSTKDETTIATGATPQSLEETMQSILQLDKDGYYFLSGQVDEEIYDPTCVFSDPFVSFEGQD
jgi:hypothetical protein